MDGIQPFPHAPGRTPAPAHPLAGHANPTVAKTTSDYVRALRRRVWLVFAIAVPLAIAAAVVTVKMPSVYRAVAQIQIEPPEFDPILETLVSREVGHKESSTKETYVPTKLAQLKSKGLIEKVLSNPEFAHIAASSADPAQDIIDNLQTRQIPSSNSFLVTLEGNDPQRTAKLLQAMLEHFRERAKRETTATTEQAKSWAEENLKRLVAEKNSLELKIQTTLATSKVIGPGGTNIVEQQFLLLNQATMQKQASRDDLQKQAMMSQFFPGTQDRDLSFRQARLAELIPKQKALENRLEGMMRNSRNKRSDPAIKRVKNQLNDLLDEMEELQRPPENKTESPLVQMWESLTRNVDEELRRREEAATDLLKKVQDSTAEHQGYLNDQDEKKHKLAEISAMQNKLNEFTVLLQSQKDPVTLYDNVAEPTVPVRPKRALFIVLGLILSFGLSIGLVCVLEHFDHSVKVPEHLSAGLTLPLFGVVPRIRRTALTHRGGHLWTPGAPESVEADAYRNLRASLLGAIDRIGPITTLLVTSAKAGEGKSTTALNLAATCARAGERTLLMDVDLRRPSLNGVFEHDGPELGLVDVLRGDLPWQSTLVRTGLPNLDFIPTGDTRDIPIEILGTLELRQLLIAVAGHYDRVILDGPAILGMADCRMLGRIVDAALLVVRSGSHSLRPLLRAKAMLEQSHVTIAGAVFNGLFEDLENWSSYGPYEPYGTVYRGAAARLEAPAAEPAALAGRA